MTEEVKAFTLAPGAEARIARVHHMVEYLSSLPQGENVTFESSIPADEIEEALHRARPKRRPPLRTVPVRDSFERMEEFARAEKMYRLALIEWEADRLPRDLLQLWKHRRDAAYRDYTDPFGTRTFA